MSFFRQYSDESQSGPMSIRLDRDVMAVNPTSVYAVLLAQGWIGHRALKPSTQEQGFVEPLKAHEHWHVDMSYVNICESYYFLCSILDGYSRLIVHWEIREQMTEADMEPIVQRALEKYPGVHPRIISNSGPQCIAKDFKEFIRVIELSLMRTSPYDPQSDGNNEQWHRTLTADSLRFSSALSFEDAHHIVEHFVTHYNTVRLHNTIGDVTPWRKLSRREKDLDAGWDQELEQTREHRKINLQKKRNDSLFQQPVYSV
jgi:transposase InsO family protein